MNAATMNAAGPAHRRCRRPRSCEVAAAWLTAASSSGCSGRPRARMASARAVATAVDRRRPRSVHQEIVPDSRLPTVIPTSVPATPIRLPRTVASTVPEVAAAMAGRWERKVSGLAESLTASGFTESVVMISRAGHGTAARPEGVYTGRLPDDVLHRRENAGERSSRASAGRAARRWRSIMVLQGSISSCARSRIRIRPRPSRSVPRRSSSLRTRFSVGRVVPASCASSS